MIVQESAQAHSAALGDDTAYDRATMLFFFQYAVACDEMWVVHVLEEFDFPVRRDERGRLSHQSSMCASAGLLYALLGVLC